MSHFSLMVIGDDLEEQLTPFSAYFDMPRYLRYTKQQLIDSERASIEKYKNSIYANYLKDKDAYKRKYRSPEHVDYLENILPEKLKWTDEQIYANAIKRYRPSDIGVNGEVYSTYNLNTKYDYCEIGGRWPGLLKLKQGIKPIAKPDYFWICSEKEKAKLCSENRADIARKGDIENISEIVCFALLKDGKWYEDDETLDMEILCNKNSKWYAEFQSIIAGLPEDALITIIDCHI